MSEVKEEIQESVEETVPKKKSKWKKHLFWGVFIISIVAVLVFTLVNDLSNPAELSSTMYNEFRKHWWWLLLAVAAMVAVFVGRTLKYSVLMHFFTGKPRFLTCFNATVIGRFYESVTPLGTGSQPLQMTYLRKKGISDGSEISMPVVEYCVGRLVAVFLSIVALILLMLNVFGENIMTTTMSVAIYIDASFGVLVNLGLPVLLFLSLFSRKACLRVTKFSVSIAKFFRLTKDPSKLYDKIIAKLEKNINCMKLILKRKRLLSVFVFAIGVKLAWASVGYFVVKAFGFVGTTDGWGWPEVVAINLLIQSAVTWVPTPGNAGAIDLSFWWVFNSLIPGAGAFATLIWRFLTYYSTIIFGFFVVMFVKKTVQDSTPPEKPGDILFLEKADDPLATAYLL